jgi:hypothetical protein
VTAARIEFAGPAATQHVLARLAEGLAAALTTGTPLRLPGLVMDRLSQPDSTTSSSLPRSRTAVPPISRNDPEDLAPSRRPRAHRRASRPAPAAARSESRKLTFTDGLDHSLFAGNFAEHASQAHWNDFACTSRAAPR